MIRVATPLDADLEELVHRTIGCCLRVHSELGPGLLERIYVRAICLELPAAGLPFEHRKRVPVFYRGRLLCEQVLDVVVDGRLVLEVKSVEQLAPVHQAQILSYLRASGIRVGLLMNFNVPVLKQGLRRIVL
jgi:GxxExxY protein